jgi:hypothetical protein
VPFARAINPVTHTNWEGTGVNAAGLTRQMPQPLR